MDGVIGSSDQEPLGINGSALAEFTSCVPATATNNSIITNANTVLFMLLNSCAS